FLLWDVLLFACAFHFTTCHILVNANTLRVIFNKMALTKAALSTFNSYIKLFKNLNFVKFMQKYTKKQ
ncbi:MAG: hypothetical protein WCN92_01460, partial [Eubacteriales bacterium]